MRDVRIETSHRYHVGSRVLRGRPESGAWSSALGVPGHRRKVTLIPKHDGHARTADDVFTAQDLTNT